MFLLKSCQIDFHMQQVFNNKDDPTLLNDVNRHHLFVFVVLTERNLAETFLVNFTLTTINSVYELSLDYHLSKAEASRSTNISIQSDSCMLYH